MSRLTRGRVCPSIEAVNLLGSPVAVAGDDGRLTYLSFRRFAGCPVCNLHLRSVARRIDELQRASVRVVALFHSSAELMKPFSGDLPFDVIPDPEKHHFRAYGVESGLRSVTDPRAWPALARGMLARHPSSAITGEGGHLGLPADFLVDTGGRIAELRYGTHADDQWSVDEVLELARRAITS